MDNIRAKILSYSNNYNHMNKVKKIIDFFNSKEWLKLNDNLDEDSLHQTLNDYLSNILDRFMIVDNGNILYNKNYMLQPQQLQKIYEFDQNSNYTDQTLIDEQIFVMKIASSVVIPTKEEVTTNLESKLVKTTLNTNETIIAVGYGTLYYSDDDSEYTFNPESIFFSYNTVETSTLYYGNLNVGTFNLYYDSNANESNQYWQYMTKTEINSIEVENFEPKNFTVGTYVDQYTPPSYVTINTDTDSININKTNVTYIYTVVTNEPLNN